MNVVMTLMVLPLALLARAFVHGCRVSSAESVTAWWQRVSELSAVSPGTGASSIQAQCLSLVPAP